MSCACSRQRHRAEMSGRTDVTLHCLPNGNFEALQCDMEICWCADEYDGHILPGTFAVPEALLTYLPCCRLTDVVNVHSSEKNFIIFRQLELSWRRIFEKV